MRQDKTVAYKAKTKKNKSKFKCDKMVARVDQLGSPVPSFNVQGETTINTGFGGCISLVTILLTMIYALDKFITFYKKEDPAIYGETLRDSTEQIRLQETDVVMAFALESAAANQLKEDPRYIRTFAYNKVKHVDGRVDHYPIELHKCTDDDWDQFHEIDRKSKPAFDRIKDADGWMCLDW